VEVLDEEWLSWIGNGLVGRDKELLFGRGPDMRGGNVNGSKTLVFTDNN
jgi:hypothetical protein